MSGKLLATETRGSNEKVELYELNGGLHFVSSKSYFKNVRQVFEDVFLPQGYPASVSSDYLEYQMWDTLQAFASSITGMLATRAILQGVGVGDVEATPLAAAITWLLKDGAGMVGKIVFVWFRGTSLDYDAKQWRLFADILNDVAILFEIASPLFPSFVTPILCAASVSKAIVGVAGGATRAALTQHQARRNNIADVAAKDQNQETLVNLSALICSLVLLPVVSGNIYMTWTLFLIFTTLHILANFFAVRAVVMETLNEKRFHILVKSFLREQYSRMEPVVVNSMEPIICGRSSRPMRIRLGCSLRHVVKSTGDWFMMSHSSGKYRLGIDFGRDTIGICLSDDASSTDQIAAYFQSKLISFALISGESQSMALTPLHNATEARDPQEILGISETLSRELFPQFLTTIRNHGWITSYNLLGADEWRIVNSTAAPIGNGTINM